MLIFYNSWKVSFLRGSHGSFPAFYSWILSFFSLCFLFIFLDQFFPCFFFVHEILLYHPSHGVFFLFSLLIFSICKIAFRCLPKSLCSFDSFSLSHHHFPMNETLRFFFSPQIIGILFCFFFCQFFRFQFKFSHTIFHLCRCRLRCSTSPFS